MADRRSHAVLQIKLKNAATSIMIYTRWKSDCSNSCLIRYEYESYHSKNNLSWAKQYEQLVPNTESFHQYDKNCMLLILLNSKGNK
jgi:hypothetical protein